MKMEIKRIKQLKLFLRFTLPQNLLVSPISVVAHSKFHQSFLKFLQFFHPQHQLWPVHPESVFEFSPDSTGLPLSSLCDVT